MNVGIYTPYERAPATIAALQLADFLARQGHVSILSPTAEPARVDPAWDARVCTEPLLGFADWLDVEAPRVVVWTRCGDRASLELAEARGVLTVLLATCCEDEESLRTLYPRYHRVVAPSTAAGRLLAERYRLANLLVCPWSPMRPVTKRHLGARDGGCRIGVHLWCIRSRFAADEAARLLFDIVRESPTAEVTAIWGDGQGHRLRAGLARTRRHIGRRLRMRRVGDWPSEVVALLDQDLAVVPAVGEPFGLVALAALHMGTPVATFDIPPSDEFIVHKRNGLRSLFDGTACESPGDSLENFARLAGAVGDSVESGCLAGWFDNTGDGLAERRRRFESCWTSILDAHLDR